MFETSSIFAPSVQSVMKFTLNNHLKHQPNNKETKETNLTESRKTPDIEARYNIGVVNQATPRDGVLACLYWSMNQSAPGFRQD